MLDKIKNRLDRMWKRSTVYHVYFRRSGFYSFIGKHSLKLVGALVLFVIAILIIQHFVSDVDVLFLKLFSQLTTREVLTIFYVSETIFGLIPPDFFILWGNNFEYPYKMVGVLAILSYAGGFTAYLIGRRLSYTERINNYLNKRFKDHFGFVHKWGGFFIVLAALFPLPYAIASLVAGIVRFPMKSFLLFGSTRILRFFLYALALFQIAG